MNGHSTVQFERTSPQIARITFANPPVNLTVAETVLRLTQIAAELETDPDIRAVIFDSSVPDFFFNHFDLAAAAAHIPTPEDADAIPVWTDLVLRLTKAPCITIGSIRGRTRGGGNELALAFDLRYASRQKAFFGQPEVGSGLLPGGGTERLPRDIGRDRALEVIPQQRRLRRRYRGAVGMGHQRTPRRRTRRICRHHRRPRRLLRPHLTRIGQSHGEQGCSPPDADLVAAYGEFAHSLTLPGFPTRAAGAAAMAAEAGIDAGYRLGEYIGIANQQR